MSQTTTSVICASNRPIHRFFFSGPAENRRLEKKLGASQYVDVQGRQALSSGAPAAASINTDCGNKDMRISLNGEPRDIDEKLTVEGLVLSLNLRPERVAVERNRLVVRRAEWSTTQLAADDVVEILTFVGGG